MRLRLPDGLFIAVISGYKLLKDGHSSKKIKIVKSKKYVCTLDIKKKKLEILREATTKEAKEI